MMRIIRRLLAAAMLLLALAAFLWFENNTIITTEYSASVAGLPEEFEGFRIVQLADLHGKSFGTGNARLLQAVHNAKPDLIAICGDLVDHAKEMSSAIQLAGELTEIAPTYYVTGNHEWAGGVAGTLMESLKQAGVIVLANEFRLLQSGAASLVLAGAHDPNGPADMLQPEKLVEMIRDQAGDCPVVMLSHRNDALMQWSVLGVELVLSGHGHGGVIRLPGVGGLLGTDRSLFPDYTAGLYARDGTQMIVSRGLGNSGGVPRLFNRPELCVVTLTSK